tara:strand:- start:821 stop:973 length:153 start_codon:yes stop_codon:yes gene_type:complete
MLVIFFVFKIWIGVVYVFRKSVVMMESVAYPNRRLLEHPWKLDWIFVKNL